MAPPKPAPIVAPRRGKFLSAPSSSPSASVPNTPSSTGSKTRGKFLGKNPSSSSPQGATSGGPSNSGDADNDTLGGLISQIHTSKVAAASRRKALSGQREQAFKDLDEAENLVLSLLECASDVAGALSGMTTAKSKNDEAGDDGEVKDVSFEELTAKVRANGVGYLAGVKKLHKLLVPHASLVKSYKSHDRGELAGDGQQSQKSLATLLPSASGATSSIASSIVEEATSNMYAARVKKRLAVERNEILNELIRLEEHEDDGDNNDGRGNGTANADPAGSKRKHESIE